MKIIWMILAGACGAIAAFFVFRGDFESAFVAAAIGAVCWFLNYRQQLRKSLSKRDEEEQSIENEESDEEVPS